MRGKTWSQLRSRAGLILTNGSSLSLLVQREGQPFSRAKIDQSITALKGSGQVKEVQIEIRPQADGVRVLLVCQPAIYFGIFNFPGADGRFAYSRLLQVSDYPPRGAYSPVDIQNAQTSLTQVFSAEWILRGGRKAGDPDRYGA